MAGSLAATKQRVRSFTSVQVRDYDRSSNSWKIRENESDVSLDQQINDWQRDTQAVVCSLSAPSVQLYTREDGSRLVVTSLALLYLPAVEGQPSDAAEQPDTDVYRSP